ncbi:unnamed protein product [Phytophthora lilii]|uniref:Unnamed protein product n=1 Tax=Phytophthora lilii TaxID=2077276 RepID=A0A9W6TGA3_9STRA|nr:unnamed protein product [Phytophthora lilii]
MEPGGGSVSSAAVSRVPQGDPRDAASTDRWASFWQSYESFFTRELAPEHAQLARALRQLERETRLEQERQSAQVLATLRPKDARISELQRLVSEQREQLDVVLDELERRETKEDKEVQVGEKIWKEDVSVQTESTEMGRIEIETQTEPDEGSGVLEVLKKLEKELKVVEERNLALEKELQQRVLKSEGKESEDVVIEEREQMETCLKTLQRGVDAMDLSCKCVDTPLMFFAGVPGVNDQNEGGGNGSKTLSTCVNLEHRLEAQTARIEHIQECMHFWRDAVVQLIKRHNLADHDSTPVIPLISSSTVSHTDKKESGVMDCAVALRGALAQMRRHCFHYRDGMCNNRQTFVKDLATTISKGHNGAKLAAKMVQRWAGWEANHLMEVRAMRQGIAEERALAVSRRIALLKKIDSLEQRKLDLQAEVNVLKKNRDRSCNGPLSLRQCKSEEMVLGLDKRASPIDYPQLMLKLLNAEQNLLAKDEQLKSANATIRALSSGTLSAAASGTIGNNPLIPLQQRYEVSWKQEKDLVNLGQFFQLEKKCLQLQARLSAEQKRAATLQAAQYVYERERDELLMKVEKLESEAMLAQIHHEVAELPQFVNRGCSLTDLDNTPDVVSFYTIRRLRLLEDDRNRLLDQLRQSQQQLAVMAKQQRLIDSPDMTVSGETIQSVLGIVDDHHRKCINEFQAFHDRHSCPQASASVENEASRKEKPVVHSSDEWSLLLNHYKALWAAFHTLYSLFRQMHDLMDDEDDPRAMCISLLRVFGFQDGGGTPTTRAGSMHIQRHSLQMLEFELSKRDEKLVLLLQKLTNYEERFCGRSSSDGSNNVENCKTQQDKDNCSDKRVYPSINSKESDFVRDSSSDKHFAEVVADSKDGSSKPSPGAGHPFLVVKPQEPPPQFTSMSSNGPSNEAAIMNTPRGKTHSSLMESYENTDTTAKELEKCLAKCAELVSQNAKLTQRLRTEKEMNKQYVKEKEKLRIQLSERTEANSELQHTLQQYRERDTVPKPGTRSSNGGKQDEIILRSDGDGEDTTASATFSSNHTASQNKRADDQEHETLREQLASREQENLALVQSLCAIKEKYAQMETIHQKQLRVKAAEHAEAMETYMSTINETLSRIESDKHRLEDENGQLRVILQQLKEEKSRYKQEKSQRSSKSTNTVEEYQPFDLTAFTQEKAFLIARVQDLELQLARERKLCEAVEQKQHLQNLQEEEQETKATLEALTSKQNYEASCAALREWLSKLQHEFAEYQAVQNVSQQECDRRIEFLSNCIEEFVHNADSTPSTGIKNVTTQELYTTVMALSKDPPRCAVEGIASKLQNRKLPKQSRSSKPIDASEKSILWDSMLFTASMKQNEPDMSEAMWWKLRAARLEAYVRSAMLQNDTFEDTIRQLESGLSKVKEELSTRLERESQLTSKMVTLKSELATVKEQAALLAEKYKLANSELEKYQNEATTRSDENQRARLTVQRKTELLSQQKAKALSLQQELEEAAKKVERLAAAEKQAAILQQKAKEHTQQLLHARQCYERCHDDNVQLSLHLEKLKERHASVVARLKAARAENVQMRTELKSSATVDTKQAGIERNNSSSSTRGNQENEASAISVASLSEENRALKRRVLQKQDVIVSYKTKVAEYEAQLDRQRETMVKLARNKRELQQGQRQRLQQEHDTASTFLTKLESQLELKQEQLDGLRASVYDSFEAFVHCRTSAVPKSPSASFTASLDSPLTDEAPDDGESLFAIKRWTDFSTEDLEELKLARGPRRAQIKREEKNRHNNRQLNKRKAATAALREVESALEVSPEDCRAEICELLQHICS